MGYSHSGLFKGESSPDLQVVASVNEMNASCGLQAIAMASKLAMVSMVTWTVFVGKCDSTVCIVNEAIRRISSVVLG